jgi:hypothetical protein
MKPAILALYIFHTNESSFVVYITGEKFQIWRHVSYVLNMEARYKYYIHTTIYNFLDSSSAISAVF